MEEQELMEEEKQDQGLTACFVKCYNYELLHESQQQNFDQI